MVTGKRYAIDFKMSDGSTKTVEFEVPLAELVGALMRDGSTPMENNLPMGGYRIRGLGEPAENGDAVNLGYLKENFAATGLHRSYGSLKDIGITTFPTTMATVVSKMPANSMIVIDTRRINGASADTSTETISDWGSSINGMALIMKGYSNARVSMMILYGTTAATKTGFYYGNYAATDNVVNWSKSIPPVTYVSNKDADLNSYTEEGLYYFNSVSKNVPFGSNGWLEVKPSEHGHVKQVWYRMGTPGTNDYQTAVRTCGSNGTFGGWTKYATEKESVRMEQVWKNGSPTSSFAKQDVTVDLSDCAWVAIEYRWNTNFPNLITMFVPVGTAYSLTHNDHIYMAMRPVKPTATGVHFDTVYTNSPNDASTYMIPNRIFKVRGFYS